MENFAILSKVVWNFHNQIETQNKKRNNEILCGVSLMPVGKQVCLSICPFNIPIVSTKNPYVLSACLCIS